MQKNNLILAVVSVIVSLILVCGGYEGYKHYQYRQWQEAFKSNPTWYGGLTIPSPNPVLLWEYRPLASYTKREPGYESTITTNRFGFRDRDYPSPGRTPGVSRTAFIGDSVAMGLGVEADRTFVALVGEKAHAKTAKPRLEAMNFGLDGYNAVQICELLRSRVLGFKPDKVIYVLCLNDFDLDDGSAQKMLYFREPKSFLYQRFKELVQLASKQEYHVFHFEKNKRVVFEKIREMKRLSDERGIAFEVVIMPLFLELPAGIASYPLGFMHDEIRKNMGEAGIPTVDLLESFKQQPIPLGEFGIDVWHLNSLGHRFVAGVLTPEAVPRKGIQ